MALVVAGGEQARPALAELAVRHSRTLHRIAWRVLGDASEAEDIVQEVFLRLWTRPRWRMMGARPGTWLHRVALNAALDARRRRSKTAELDDSLAQRLAVADDAMEGGQQLSLQRLAGRMLARLPARQARVLVLCYMEGMSGQRASAILGISPKAVESLLGRARANMRALLAKHRIRVEDL